MSARGGARCCRAMFEQDILRRLKNDLRFRRGEVTPQQRQEYLPRQPPSFAPSMPRPWSVCSRVGRQSEADYLISTAQRKRAARVIGLSCVMLYMPVGARVTCYTHTLSRDALVGAFGVVCMFSRAVYYAASGVSRCRHAFRARSATSPAQLRRRAFRLRSAYRYSIVEREEDVSEGRVSAR